MGRKPLEKAKKKHKKGLWSPDEDQKLTSYVMKHGHRCWTSVPINAGLLRNGKSCRLRWKNYLQPGLKRGALSEAEEETILTLHQILGNKWSQIAHHLPGRTDNEVKNYWHSYLKKRVAKVTETDYRSARIQGLELSTSQNSSCGSFEHVKGSLMDAEQSTQKYCSLPRVIFAEWLSFDQFYGQDLGNNNNINYASESKNNFEYHSSKNDLDEDSLVDGLVVDEGIFVSGKNPNTSMEIYVDDIMLQFAAFELEYQISESGVVQF